MLRPKPLRPVIYMGMSQLINTFYHISISIRGVSDPFVASFILMYLSLYVVFGLSREGWLKLVPTMLVMANFPSTEPIFRVAEV